MKLLAALGLAALVLMACSKSEAPSKPQYNGVANGVCTATHDDLAKKAAEHMKTKPDGGANQRFVRAIIISRRRGLIGQLKGIPRPDIDGPYLDSLYADYDHALALLYSDPLGDSSKAAASAVEVRMKTYGMAACSTAGHIEVSTAR
jgi:hypothetical protein